MGVNSLLKTVARQHDYDLNPALLCLSPARLWLDANHILCCTLHRLNENVSFCLFALHRLLLLQGC